MKMNSKIWTAAVLKTMVTAILYVITGQLGFYLAISPGNVTAVWPPSGVAIAAVLIRGIPAWVGIWLGAFIVNAVFFTKAAPVTLLALLAACAIALGSTLQAVIAGYSLRRRIADNSILSHPGDAFLFIAISGACCLIGASVGVTSLCLADFVPWSNYGYTWLTWWAGDTGGILVFTPLIMSWRKLPEFVKNRRRLIEFGVFLVLLMTCCYIVFGDTDLGRHHFPLLFCVFPFLVWAAGRFGISGVTVTVPLVEIFAIIGMRKGFGPLAYGTMNESLLLLAVFMASLSLIGLTFASILSQWQNVREKLENTAQELEVKVLNRTAELQEANRSLLIARDRAVEASSIKSAFVANMSHELRTPLSGIIGITEILLTYDVDRQLREMLEIVHQSGNTLLTLVTDILDFSKIEAGKVTLQYEPFSPVFLVQDCTKLFAPAAAIKKLKLTTSLDTQLPQFVYGDAARLRQSLLYLIGNAIKFTEQGYVRVSAELMSEDDQRLTIQFIVEDTGIGIEKDKEQILFKPFSQVDDTATRRFGGAGLGLAISKQLVEIMGGEISFESELHAGSVFRFSIPFDKPSSRLQRGDSGGMRKPSIEQLPKDLVENRRVLVVEDNALLRDITSMQLISLGLACNVVENGAMALAEFKTGRYDLILMDIYLPDISGYEVCIDIRRIESERNDRQALRVPIIALTAGAMTGDRDAALAAGMDDYLAKPVRIDELRQVLLRWLSYFSIHKSG